MHFVHAKQHAVPLPTYPTAGHVRAYLVDALVSRVEISRATAEQFVERIDWDTFERYRHGNLSNAADEVVAKATEYFREQT